MAARLVSPYPLVWSTGLARAGVGCHGPYPDQVLAGRRGLGAAGVPGRRRGQGSESSQTQLAGFEGSGSSSTQPESPGSHHAPAPRRPRRPPGAGTPTRGRMPRQLGDGVGSGVPLGRVARAAPNGLEETRTGPWGAEDDLAAFPQGEDRPT